MAKRKRQSRLANTRGQAAVEYVLLLILSVAILVALTYQVFTPMRDFFKDYMGTYISCLLETGELPSFGNEDTQEVLQSEGCNAKFKPATLAGGRPPAQSSSASSSENSSETSNANSSSGKNGSEGSGSSDGSSGGAGNASTGRNLLTNPRNRNSADGPAAANAKVTEISMDPESSKFFNRKSSSETV
ncbi:MAG: hypothetical protein EOP06_26610, partial [Proteobacteria bacterium]